MPQSRHVGQSRDGKPQGRPPSLSFGPACGGSSEARRRCGMKLRMDESRGVWRGQKLLSRLQGSASEMVATTKS